MVNPHLFCICNLGEILYGIINPHLFCVCRRQRFAVFAIIPFLHDGKEENDDDKAQDQPAADGGDAVPGAGADDPDGV